jgi:hypothetical protein
MCSAQHLLSAAPHQGATQGQARADPDRRGRPDAAALRYQHVTRNGADPMLAIIALVLIAVVAVIILTAAVHILFSPLLLIAIAVLVWLRFRPRRHV